MGIDLCGQVTWTEMADLREASWEGVEKSENAEFSLEDRKAGAAERKEISDGEESSCI